jgi:hypothetical protein
MFLAMSAQVAAQTTKEGAADPLFASHDVIDVRIEAPLRTLIRERSDEEYLDGFFTYQLADGSEQKLDLKLRTRGKYRRQKKTCTLPPIRLNFNKGQVKDTVFAGQDKLKLVTHCKSTSDRYQQLVLREYLAYRILQTLTDNSFGARLMRIEYIDTEGKEKPVTRYGFVIEDDDDIADRIGLARIKVPSTSYDALDPRQTNLVAVYEFLIGNTDFSMIAGPADSDCCHNIVLYGNGNQKITPIPYDFDFSGIVDAPYAEPNPQFKLRTVRIRLYRGRCSNNQYLPDTFALFKAQEAEIRSIVTALDLESRHAREVAEYIDDFYEIIGDEGDIEKKFTRECS